MLAQAKTTTEREIFIEEWDRVHEDFRQQLVIAMVGTVSSGKTTAIAALMDINFVNSSPIPGSTTEAKVARIAENVYVADVPGFGDINTQLSAKAKTRKQSAVKSTFSSMCSMPRGDLKLPKKKTLPKSLPSSDPHWWSSTKSI